MANNKIQIKRSTANATVTGLSNGELAFTQAGNILYIGAPDGTSGSLRIGGLQVPGTLTANQALVANATSGIDKVITANLVANSIWANGAAGASGDVLTSNGTAIYWRAPSAGVAGSDTQVQFNDGGNLAGDPGFTFVKASDTLTVNGTITTGDTGTGTGGFLANDTIVWVGNNTVNTTLTSSGLFVNGTATIANSSGVYTTGTVNAAAHTSGAIGTGAGGTVQNTTTMFIGNNTINTVITSAGLNVNAATIANNTGFYTTGTVNAASHTVGTATIANATGVFTTGTVNGAVLSVGTSSIANSTGVFTTGTVNGATLSVGSSVIANSSRLAIGTAVGLQVNGTIGTAGQILYSNGTTAYWAAAPTGDITSVTAGSGLTGGGTSGDVTLDIGQGNGITVSADAIAVLGGPTVTVNTTGVHVNSTLSITDLTLTGNLTVLGDLVSLNVATISVEDSMITLAKDQSATATFTDAVDIGFFGTYGNTTNSFISGIFRDQSDSGIWKVFASNGTFTNAAINTANTDAFKLGTLQSFLISGGLISNLTHVAITANSTVNVSIVANNLTLSGRANNDLLFTNSIGGVTARALGADGFVLQSNGSAIVYDTLDGGTF